VTLHSFRAKCSYMIFLDTYMRTGKMHRSIQFLAEQFPELPSVYPSFLTVLRC